MGAAELFMNVTVADGAFYYDAESWVTMQVTGSTVISATDKAQFNWTAGVAPSTLKNCFYSGTNARDLEAQVDLDTANSHVSVSNVAMSLSENDAVYSVVCLLRFTSDVSAIVSLDFPGTAQVMSNITLTRAVATFATPFLYDATTNYAGAGAPDMFIVDVTLSARLTGVTSISLFLTFITVPNYNEATQYTAGPCQFSHLDITASLPAVEKGSPLKYTSPVSTMTIAQGTRMRFKCPATWTVQATALGLPGGYVNTELELVTATGAFINGGEYARLEPLLGATSAVTIVSLDVPAPLFSGTEAGIRGQTSTLTTVSLATSSSGNGYVYRNPALRLTLASGATPEGFYANEVVSLAGDFGPQAQDERSATWSIPVDSLVSLGDGFRTQSLYVCIHGLSAAYPPKDGVIRVPGSTTVCSLLSDSMLSAADSDSVARSLLPAARRTTVFELSSLRLGLEVSNTVYNQPLGVFSARTTDPLLPGLLPTGLHYLPRASPAAPPPRFWHAVATTAAASEVNGGIVTGGQFTFWFGGASQSKPGVPMVMRNDLWMYDALGDAWTLLAGDPFADNPNASHGPSRNMFSNLYAPAARVGAALAYDHVNHRIWLYGGTQTEIGVLDTVHAPAFDDLWMFNLQTREWGHIWGTPTPSILNSSLDPASPDPPALVGASLVVVASEGKRQLALYGGLVQRPTAESVYPYAAESSALYLCTFGASTILWTKLAGSLYGSDAAAVPTDEPIGSAFQSAVWHELQTSFYIYGGITYSRGLVGADARRNSLDSLSDSGVVGGLWRYSMSTSTWTRLDASRILKFPADRGAPRIVSVLNAQAYPTHPGGRMSPALNVGIDGYIYLYGGRGHGFGMVLPQDPRIETNLTPLAGLSPTTPLRVPLAIPFTTASAFTAHYGFLYTATELSAAGLVPGTPLIDLDVMFKVTADSAQDITDIQVSTGTHIEFVADVQIASPRELLMPFAARLLPSTPAVRLSQLVAGNFISLTSRLLPKSPAAAAASAGVRIWDGVSSALVYVRAEYVSLASATGQFGLATVSIAEPRSAVLFGAIGMSTALMKAVVSNSLPYIVIRSHMPAHPTMLPATALNPLAPAQLDDLWRFSIDEGWELIGGSLGATTAASRPTATRVTDDGTLWPGGRMGASLLLPRQFDDTDTSSYAVVVGGTAVFTSPTEDTSIDSTSSPCSRNRCLLYVDAWSLELPAGASGTAQCVDSVNILSKSCMRPDLPGQTRLVNFSPASAATILYRSEVSSSFNLSSMSSACTTRQTACVSSFCYAKGAESMCVCDSFGSGASCGGPSTTLRQYFQLKRGTLTAPSVADALPFSSVFADPAPDSHEIYSFGGVEQSEATRVPKSRLVRMRPGVASGQSEVVYVNDGRTGPTDIPASEYAFLWMNEDSLYVYSPSQAAPPGIWSIKKRTYEVLNVWRDPSMYPSALSSAISSGAPGSYSSGDAPGSRQGSAYAALGRTMCLYSGSEVFNGNRGLAYNDDLWCYSLDNNAWNRHSGHSGATVPLVPSYVTRGVFDAQNTPGSRFGASMVMYEDPSRGRYLALFGGRAVTGSTAHALYGDLWVFSFYTMSWALMSDNAVPARHTLSPSSRSYSFSRGSPSRLSRPAARMYASMTMVSGMIYIAHGLRFDGSGDNTIFATSFDAMLSVTPEWLGFGTDTKRDPLIWIDATSGDSQSSGALGVLEDAAGASQVGGSLVFKAPSALQAGALYLIGGLVSSAVAPTAPYFFSVAPSEPRPAFHQISLACLTETCNGKGTCVSVSTSTGTTPGLGFICKCDSGYHGVRCESVLSTLAPCTNGVRDDLTSPCVCTDPRLAAPLCQVPSVAAFNIAGSSMEGFAFAGVASTRRIQSPQAAMAMGVRPEDPVIFSSGGVDGTYDASSSVRAWLPVQRTQVTILDGALNAPREAQKIGSHYGHSLAFSPSLGQLILYGGFATLPVASLVNEDGTFYDASSVEIRAVLVEQHYRIQVAASSLSNLRPSLLTPIDRAHVYRARPLVYSASEVSPAFDPAALVVAHQSPASGHISARGFPGARAYHGSAILTVDGNEYHYIYGGQGISASGAYGYLADMWRESTASLGNWEYVGCAINYPDWKGFQDASSVNFTMSQSCPASRSHMGFTAGDDGRLWIVGGLSSFGPLDDVWAFNPSSSGADALRWTRYHGSLILGPTAVITPSAFQRNEPANLGPVVGVSCAPGPLDASPPTVVCFGGAFFAAPFSDLFATQSPLPLSGLDLEAMSGGAAPPTLHSLALPFVTTGTSSRMAVHLPASLLAESGIFFKDGSLTGFRFPCIIGCTVGATGFSISYRFYRFTDPGPSDSLLPLMTAENTVASETQALDFSVFGYVSITTVTPIKLEAATQGLILEFHTDCPTELLVAFYGRGQDGTMYGVSNSDWTPESKSTLVTYGSTPSTFAFQGTPTLRLLSTPLFAPIGRVFSINTATGLLSSVVGPVRNDAPLAAAAASLRLDERGPVVADGIPSDSYLASQAGTSPLGGEIADVDAGSEAIHVSLRALPPLVGAGIVSLETPGDTVDGMLSTNIAIAGGTYRTLTSLSADAFQSSPLPHDAMPLPFRNKPGFVGDSSVPNLAARFLGVRPLYSEQGLPYFPTALSVVSALFTPTLSAIDVTFSATTTQPVVTTQASTANCEQVFVSSTSLGTGARCAWVSPSVFRVELGLDFKIMFDPSPAPFVAALPLSAIQAVEAPPTSAASVMTELPGPTSLVVSQLACGPAPGPPASSMGPTLSSDPIVIGTAAVYECENGFSTCLPAAASVLTCTASGWSRATPPICRNSCPTLLSIKANTVAPAAWVEFFLPETSVYVRTTTLPTPAAVITAQALVGVCAPLVFSAAQSTGSGGLAFAYKWQLIEGADNNELIAVNNYINTLALLANSFSSTGSPSYLPTLTFPVGQLRVLFKSSPALRRMRLILDTWYGRTAVSEWSFMISSDNVPVISIAGQRVLVVSRARNILVNVALAPAPVCEGSPAQTINYVWGLDSGPVPPTAIIFETQHSSLRVRAYGMPASATPYVFRVNVTATSAVSVGSQWNGTNSDTVSITVERAALRAVITGGGTSHGVSQSLRLSAEQSRDLDRDPAQDQRLGLTYQWTCSVKKADGTLPCVDSSSIDYAEVQWPPSMWADKRLALTSDQLKLINTWRGVPEHATTLSFSLLVGTDVSGDARTAAAATTVTLLTTMTHTVTVSAPLSAKVSPTLPFTLTSHIAALPGSPTGAPRVVWSCDTRNADLAAVARRYSSDPLMLATAGVYEHSLVIAGGALVPGAEYIFRVSLFPAVTPVAALPTQSQISRYEPAGPLPGEVTSSFVRIIVNSSPSSGICAAHFPGNKTIATAGEPFRIECANWADEDLPLTYQWLLLTRRKRGLSYQDVWVEVGIALPRPTLELAVERGPSSDRDGARSVAAVITDIHGASTTVLISIPFDPTLTPGGAFVGAGPAHALAATFAPLSAVDRVEERFAELAAASVLSDIRTIAQTALRIADTLDAARDTGEISSAEELAFRTRLLARVIEAAGMLSLSQDARRAVVALDDAGAGAGTGGGSADDESQFLQLAGNSEVAIELLTQICGDGARLAPAFREDVMSFLLGQSAPLASTDRFSGMGVRTAEASLLVVDSLLASLSDELAAVHPNATLPGGNNASPPGDTLAADALKAASLVSESARLANAIAQQINVAAFGALADQAVGDVASVVSAGALSVTSRPVSALMGALPSVMTAAVPPSTNDDATGADASDAPVASVRLPSSLPCVSAKTLQLVMSVVSNPVALRLAGLAPGAMLNASDSSPLVAFTVYDRDSKAVTEEPVGDETTVPVPAPLTFDLSAGAPACLNVPAPPKASAMYTLGRGLGYTGGFAGLDAPEGEFFELEIPHAAPKWHDVTFACEWWKADASGDGGAWSTEGCVLAATSETNTTTTCKCTHLTMFRVRMSFNNVVPRFNTLSASDFLNLTWSNIKEHPVPIISCLVWFVAYLIFAAFATVIDRRKDARALRQYHGEWLEPQVAQFDALTGAHPHAEDSAVSPRLRGYKPKHNGRGEYGLDATFKDRWIDFMWYSMRHDHMWLSVPKRDDTHAFSSVGRLTAAFVLVLTGYMINAMFFGNSGGDVALSSILISVISAAILIPVGFFINALFGRSQRGRLKGAIYGYAEHVTYLRWTGRDQEPEFATRLEHRLKINPVVPNSDVGYILSQIARSAGWSHGPGNVPVPSDQRAERNEVELRKQLRLLVHIDHDLFMVWYRAQWSFPSGLRLFGFVVLWMWVLACIMLILVYGMQFDLVSDGNTLTWLRASAISNALEIFAFKPATIAAKTFFLTLMSLLCCGAGDLCGLTSQRTSDDNLTIVDSCEIYRYTGADGGAGAASRAGQAGLDLQLETDDPESPPYGTGARGGPLYAPTPVQMPGFRFEEQPLSSGALAHSSSGQIELSTLPATPVRTAPLSCTAGAVTSPSASYDNQYITLVQSPTALLPPVPEAPQAESTEVKQRESSLEPSLEPSRSREHSQERAPKASPHFLEAAAALPAMAPPPPPMPAHVSLPPPLAAARLPIPALATMPPPPPPAARAPAQRLNFTDDDANYDPSRPPTVPAAPAPTGGIPIIATAHTLGHIEEARSRAQTGALPLMSAGRTPMPLPAGTGRPSAANDQSPRGPAQL